MHLKKVDIFGFKSFADKTQIFFEKGITCVVGPNGCGKSNISDAIRWVLGERSAKLLRGSKMEDVIFSGTEFRKPVGMAEVSLTIDNSDKKLPLAFEEVVLTRRLYRSGESEYLINKTPCRYKDIQDVILDTGIGSNSYSMIEQGRIDYILNAQEDERRFLIEEAAGISKYKLKKEEALRKLERTEANLLRLNDIVNEVEKNIKYAERQAKRAEKYKEKLEELKTFEIQKAMVEIDLFEKERERLLAEQSELREEIKRSETEVSSEDTGFREADQALSKMEEANSELERKKYQLKLELSQHQERIRANEEKKSELQKNNVQLERDFDISEYRLKTFQEEIAAKQTELTALNAEIQDAKQKVQTSSADFDAARLAVSEKENVIKGFQNSLFEIAREVAESKNKVHQLEIDFQQQKSRQVRAYEMTARLQTEKQECLKKIEQLRQGDFLDDFSLKKSTLEEKNGLFGNLEEDLRAAEEVIIRKRTEMKEFLSQAGLLEELQKEGLLDDSASQHIVEESRRQGSLIHGIVQTFWDVMEISEGYECAVRAALANWAHALIVTDQEQAMRVIEYAKQTDTKELAVVMKSGKTATAGPAAAPQIKGLLGTLRDFVKTVPGSESLLNEYFEGVWVMDSLSRETLAECGQSPVGMRIVTKDGFLIEPDAKIQYFGVPVKTGAGRAKDLKNLQSRALLLEAEIKNHEQDRDVLAGRFQQFETELSALKKEVLDAEIHHQSSHKLRESLQSQISRLEEEIELNRTEASQTEIELAHFATEKERLNGLSLELSRREKEYQALLQTEAAGLNALAENKDALFRLLSAEEQKLQRAQDRETHLTDSVALLVRNREAELELQQSRKKQVSDNVATLSQMEGENTSKSQQITLLEEEINRFEDVLRGTLTERAALAQRKNELWTSLQQKKSVIEKIKELERDIQLKQMDLSYKVSATDERMKQAYQVDVRALDKSAYELQNVNLEMLEQEIQAYKEKLQTLGTVNLLAIEEYESLKERYQFLLAQKQDLEKSREDLLEAIRKINRTTKKLFEDTFALVQAAFKDYFRVLFGGGEAELILVDENNPLESGIDIMVRPPGKKNQQITLLSGGEKALTATALLFSLFKIKPSPFCVLDEIDAPLDESNVHRFLEVVRGFLGQTQFIIVTHNRKTIAAGDSLYGVTMEEAGVSKLVSVKLLQDEKNPGQAKIDASGKELNVILN